MAENRQCPQCNEELPADAPMGLCPQCVLNLAAQTQQVTQAAAGSPEGQASAQSPFVPPSPQDLAASFPQLEVLELLGQGGMGAVYKARQPTLDRLVALKILPPSLGADATFAERFAREARSLARLNHPNIVGVHDFGQAGGFYYFLMEYVDGVNLRQMERTERLSPKQALAIVPQICDALQFAHDEGIVHRDIKPENILIDTKGRVKIADFGLAKLLTRAAADITLTQPQQVMGTVHYMAPEQVEHPAAVDQRADIYSLGVVFYEMLTGELPLGRFAPPSQKVQVDVRLDEVVLKTLEKEPGRRYQHATEVKTDVEQISREPEAAPPAPAPGAPPPQAAADWPARRRVMGPAAGLLIVGILHCLGAAVLGLLVALLFWKSRGVGPGYYMPLGIAGLVPWPLLAVMLACPLVALAVAVLLIVGSINMMRLRSSGWARTSAIAAMIPLPLPGALWWVLSQFYLGGWEAFLPCAALWVLGLGMGLWALWALAQPEVDAAFAAARAPRAPASPADRVRWPAIGMIGSACVNAAIHFVLLRVFGGGSPEAVAIVVMAVLIIVAAWRMLGLRSYRLAVAGGILSLIPVDVWTLIGLPFGIWALWVLTRPDVKAAFAAAAGPREAAPGGPADRLRWPAIGLIVAAILDASAVVVFLALVGPELGWWDRFRPATKAYAVALVGGPIVAAIAVCGLLLLAAMGMRRRERYGQAVAGSIAAIVVPPGCLVGIPAGILALAALSRSQVKAAFAAHEKSSPEAFSLSRIGLALVVWLAAGVVLASLGLWVVGECVPAHYTVREVIGLAPVPVKVPIPGRDGEFRFVDRGYSVECTATGEGWAWGRNPANLGLQRQRLTLEVWGLSGTTRDMKMEIDLRTLGYSYYGPDGVQVTAQYGLDARVIRDWLEARGIGVAPPNLPAAAVGQAGPYEQRTRAEAANLYRIARNWNSRYTTEMLDEAVFRQARSEVEKSVRVVPVVEPAAWIAVASLWLGGGALWLRRLRRLRRPQGAVRL